MPATRDLLVTSSYAAKHQYVPVNRGGALPVENMKTYAIGAAAQGQVKSLMQEKTSNGWRIGAVIKLNNTSGSTIRVPDYELRVKTAAGTVYTLQPSASNGHSILPQSSNELSYLVDIEVKTDISLTDLLWIDVNEKVYPKQETLLADAPIGSIVWRGKDAVINDPTLLGDWGVTFSVPGAISALKYSATSMSKQFSGQSPTYIVQLKVVNPGSYTETVPDFILSGKAEGQSFIGKRVEEGPITLNPGDQKNIHFAITTNTDTKLNAFYVLSSESFLPQGQTAPIQYYTGRIGFRLPTNADLPPAGSTYTFGTSMVFEQGNDFINPNLDVSLVELHVTDNKETGNKTGLAKFKLINKGDKPIPVPVFQTELTGTNGYTYSGNRQTVSTQDIAPGTASVVSYGYTLPSTEQSDQYKLNVQAVLPGGAQGQSSGAGYRSTIASYKVSTQSDNDHNNISLYPFKLNLKSWTLSQITMMGAAGFSYTYKLNLDMDVTREPVVVLDNSFSMLKFDLVDGLGRSLGSNSFPFTGTNRLVSGSQELSFSNLTQKQVQNNVSIKVYEAVTTPTGEVDRFITELK
jgi:hypothetical protein